MLKHHTPTCNHKPIKPCGAIDSNHNPIIPPYKHKTGDDEEEEDDVHHSTIGNANTKQTTKETAVIVNVGIEDDTKSNVNQEKNYTEDGPNSNNKNKNITNDNIININNNNTNNNNMKRNLSTGEEGATSIAATIETGSASGNGDHNIGASGETSDVLGGGLKIKLPEVACTICGAHFSDQELFAKHIQMHEMELYTDNPLASMFDTDPADPNQFYMDRLNENGEYACDLCTKSFTQMTAFKVHRKWHFRGDSKQVSLWTCAARQRLRTRAYFSRILMFKSSKKKKNVKNDNDNDEDG